MSHDADAAPESATDPAASETPARQKFRPKLDDEMREYIVRRLAAYERPIRLRREMRERFGIELSHGSIEFYDPTRNAGCSKRWADLFYTVRKAHIGGQSDQATKSRKVERLVLRTVEILADRILNGVLAEAQGFATDAGEITDADRLRALVAFIEKLKITYPPGVAEIRRVLFNDLGPHGDSLSVAFSDGKPVPTFPENALPPASAKPRSKT